MVPQLAVTTLVLALLPAPAAVVAADECTADVHGFVKREQGGRDRAKYKVRIDVSARAKCAEVRFDVVVVEENPSGERFEIRIPQKVKIRDSGFATRKFEYAPEKGRAVVDHRFGRRSCEACG